MSKVSELYYSYVAFNHYDEKMIHCYTKLKSYKSLNINLNCKMAKKRKLSRFMSFANHIIPPQGKIGILCKKLLINQKFAISL